MKTKNASTPQIEEIIIYLLLDKETHAPYKSYIDYRLAYENAGTDYLVSTLELNTDSDSFTIQNLQGAINKDVNL